MGSRMHLRDIKHGPPLAYQDDIRAFTKEYAEALDAQDPLRQFREQFIIPSKKDLKRTVLVEDESRYPSLTQVELPSSHPLTDPELPQTRMTPPTLDAFTSVETRWECSPEILGNSLIGTSGHGLSKA